MITRADSKTISGVYEEGRSPKLTSLEKSMLKWVTVDRDDKVLDANVGNGLVAEYLRRNMVCEVCGFSTSMKSVREARSCLQNCDIMFAGEGDIPWHTESFDTVLLRMDADMAEHLKQTFDEVNRVLKQGGQFVLGVSCGSRAINYLMSVLSDDETRGMLGKEMILGKLKAAGFDHILWQRTGICQALAIAWKKNEQAEF